MSVHIHVPRWILWPAAGCCLLVPRTLPAQSLDQIRAGAKLRIELRDTSVKRLTGTLVAYSPDGLALRPHGSSATATLAPSRVGQVEVSLERRSNASQGGLIGLLIGFGIGAAMASGCDCGDQGAAVTVYGLLMGGVGMGFGALLGAGSSHDVWQAVAVPPPVAANQGT